MPFDYDPDAGVEFIGKVIFARETTAAEFDRMETARLSNQVGAGQEIFYFKAENLEAPPGAFRATFFIPDNRPVAKWFRFKRACKDIGITIKRNADGTTDLEGKYLVIAERQFDIGKKYAKPGEQTGKANTLEPAGIPSPEEIEALEARRKAAVGVAPPPAPSVPRDEVATIILQIAEGLTEDELRAQMESMDYKGWETVLGELKAKQSIVTVEGKLKLV